MHLTRTLEVLPSETQNWVCFYFIEKLRAKARQNVPHYVLLITVQHIDYLVVALELRFSNNESE